MIVLDAITKTFGGLKAVDGVTLHVNTGEIFGLVGPDGAGKTTLIRMLTGILDPTSGALSVLGSAQPEKIKDRIGYVPQRFSLYGDLTVMENIRVLGMLYGQNKSEIEARATEILTFTNLIAFRDRLADNLSGGMKQKLALAAGLMHRPEIFFLDEPTTGVDPVSRREFWQMLYRLNKEGTSVFVSTPYMDEAEFCTRVAFMHNGRIVACDSPERLRRAYPYRLLELTTSKRLSRSELAKCRIEDVNLFGEKYHLVVRPTVPLETISTELTGAGIDCSSLIEIAPSLEDVFVALASEVA